MDLASQLRALDVTITDGELVAHTPIDGTITARLPGHDAAAVAAAVTDVTLTIGVGGLVQISQY